MKKLFLGLLILSSISTFADTTDYVVCTVEHNSQTGLAGTSCLPKGYVQTDTLFPFTLGLNVLNKGFSALEEKMVAVKYLKDFGIELKSEAVYPNVLANKKDEQTYTTIMTFSSSKRILLQKMP